MITGLVQVRGRGARRPTARRTSQLVAVIAVLAMLGAGTQLVLAQDGDGGGASAEDLVQRLVEIEDQVAGVPFLPDVTVQPETTWGVINGDFVGARVLLDEVADDLDSLVNDASDADGEVADAVETVANSYRTMREGYGYLAAYEQAGLGVEPPPADGEAEGEGDAPPATAESGTDEPRGQAEVGLSLLLEALSGFADGYDILRNVDEAADARSLFEVRYSETQQAAQTEALDVRTALSYPATNLMVAVDRFDPQFGGEPPAQVVRYACVDRGPYLEDRSEGNVPDLPMPEGEQAELPIPDCPNLTNGNETRLIQPEAASN